MAQIDKPNLHFNTKLYTGTGSSVSFTGVGFQPDFVWCKVRSAGSAVDHNLFDAVRGVQKRIESNSTAIEATRTNALSAFDSDGFSFNGSNTAVNSSGDTYVAWNWKANGAGSADTSGTINSTVSANTTAGFSIVKYVGDGTGGNNTIAHGLGVAPDMVLYKNLDSARNWIVYHKAMGATKNLYLDLTNAENTASNTFNNVAPTSTFLNVNDSVGVNESGDNHIAYCFAEKKGYSKFGSYTGNSSTDGTFVYTGFKPSFVIYKGFSGANTADNWEMADNKRSPFNGVENVLYPNLNNLEGTGVTTRMDLLSNGFKMRTSGSDYNNSSASYIYMAFAENPIVGSNNVPATAR